MCAPGGDSNLCTLQVHGLPAAASEDRCTPLTSGPHPASKLPDRLPATAGLRPCAIRGSVSVPAGESTRSCGDNSLRRPPFLIKEGSQNIKFSQGRRLRSVWDFRTGEGSAPPRAKDVPAPGSFLQNPTYEVEIARVLSPYVVQAGAWTKGQSCSSSPAPSTEPTPPRRRALSFNAHHPALERRRQEYLIMATREGRKPRNEKSDNPGFVSEYRHNRTGKLMRARDYGYTGWPFGRRKKK